jgi:nucleotide-binding universal stress UspA family protein
MPKIKKILAPTDFSELSKLGLRYALETARDENAEVIVYHVIDFTGDWTNRQPELKPYRDMLENSRQGLDRFLDENFAESINQVKVGQVVEFGAPYQNIVDKASTEGVDMIVMSTHGRTGIDNFLIGSVAQKVVAHASCPVLVVPRCAGERATTKAARAPASSRSEREFPGEDVGLLGRC